MWRPICEQKICRETRNLIKISYTFSPIYIYIQFLAISHRVTRWLSLAMAWCVAMTTTTSFWIVVNHMLRVCVCVCFWLFSIIISHLLSPSISLFETNTKYKKQLYLVKKRLLIHWRLITRALTATRLWDANHFLFRSNFRLLLLFFFFKKIYIWLLLLCCLFCIFIIFYSQLAAMTLNAVWRQDSSS